MLIALYYTAPAALHYTVTSCINQEPVWTCYVPYCQAPCPITSRSRVTYTRAATWKSWMAGNLFVPHSAEQGLVHLHTFCVRKYLIFWVRKIVLYLVILGVQVVKWVWNWVCK